METKTLVGEERGAHMRRIPMRKPLAELFLQVCEENVKLALRDGRKNPVLSVQLHPSIPQALEIITQCPCTSEKKEPGIVRWIVQRRRLS